jgi:2'-5' RNA ligase
MPVAIELDLDPASAAAVRRVWRELEDAGVTYMARSGASPHVSLGIWEALDLPAARAALAALARETAPEPVTFTGVGTFPGNVVYLAAEATPRLLELHARVHRCFAPLGSGPWRHYASGVWVPHCTLAADFAEDRLATVLAIARRAPPPGGRLERAGIVEFRPVKPLCAFDLGVR